MKVCTAKTAGFCFGVKRAVDTVMRESSKEGMTVCTYGPIIHNDQVVSELARRGVRVIEDPAELRDVDSNKKGVVILRSHGVTREEHQALLDSGWEVVDATCPFVKKIHRIAEKTGEAGRILVVAGDPDHPEVKGIVGWARGEVNVVRNPEEARSLSLLSEKPATLVAQTTFNAGKFEEIVEIFKIKGYDRDVVNTVCSATDERQAEARDLSRRVDAMIVVGGTHSSNTRKLYEICKENCWNTYLIETLTDLDTKPFQSFSCVGITAGASTPKSIIEEVSNYVRTEL